MGNNVTIPTAITEVPPEANKLNLFDADNLSEAPIAFESLYKDAQGPVVIKFFRRFGCLLCREAANENYKLKPVFDKKYGKDVVKIIGVGLERLGYDEFSIGKYFEGKVYLDETHAIYKALGFVNLGGTLTKLRKFISTDTLSRGKEASNKGFKGDFRGETSQLGGLLILSPTGELIYQFRQENYGDEAKKEDIVQAVEQYFEKNQKGPTN